MVKQKKIVCICMIFALLPALCAASAFADDESSSLSSETWSDIHFAGQVYRSSRAVYNNGDSPRILNYQYNSLPVTDFSLNIGNSDGIVTSVEQYVFMPCDIEPFGDGPQLLDPFRTGYSYKGRVYFSISYRISDDNPVSKFPTFSIGVNSGTSVFSGENGFSGFLFYDYLPGTNWTQYWSSIAGTYVTETGTYRTYSYIVDFAFNCHGEEEGVFSVDWESYKSLGLYFKYDHDSSFLANGWADCSVTWTDISCKYDPSGSDVPEPSTDTEQIVDGQIVAAQYALDQEESANQQASSDAAGQGTTAASTVFSGSSSVITNLRQFFSMLTSTSTSFSFTFPGSGNVPYLGQLWTSQTIPIKQWIDAIPNSIKAIVRFIVIFGAVSVLVTVFRKIILVFRGDDK